MQANKKYLKSLVLAVQPHFTNPKSQLVGIALAKSVFLFSIGFILSKYLLKWVFEKISKTPEMVVAMSIAWCVFMAGMGQWIGLSMEMGALIAGVAISSFPYGVHVIASLNLSQISEFSLVIATLGITYGHIEQRLVIIIIYAMAMTKGTTNESIVRTCRSLAPRAVLIATADSADQIGKLKNAGANDVLLPYSMIGEWLANFVATFFQTKKG